MEGTVNLPPFRLISYVPRTGDSRTTAMLHDCSLYRRNRARMCAVSLKHTSNIQLTSVVLDARHTLITTVRTPPRLSQSYEAMHLAVLYRDY